MADWEIFNPTAKRDISHSRRGRSQALTISMLYKKKKKSVERRHFQLCLFFSSWMCCLETFQKWWSSKLSFSKPWKMGLDWSRIWRSWRGWISLRYSILTLEPSTAHDLLRCRLGNHSVTLLQKILFSLGGSFLYYADRFKIYSAFCASHTKVPKVLVKGE